MKTQDQWDYERIAVAIEYIKENFRQQPNLDEVANQVHLSPFHFQRLFTTWAGVSPKKFVQYISLEYAKNLLKGSEMTLFDVAGLTGLSSTSRLHDLFVTIEGMTPGEYKNGGENLRITYNFYSSPFGEILMASTAKGICYSAFVSDRTLELNRLKAAYPQAFIAIGEDPMHEKALYFCKENQTIPNQIRLHVKGSEFQLKVWEALLKIPVGQLSTYGSIAMNIHQPNASRAVGTAIGSNPVAYLIPCHRVIQSSGHIGGYMWGPIRKTAIIGWEMAKSNENQSNP